MKEPSIFDDPKFNQAFAHIACEIVLSNDLKTRLLFAQAARYANLDYYKPTIPTNPLHEIFMAKVKGYMMRKMYPKNAADYHRQEDSEVLYQRSKLLPTDK